MGSRGSWALIACMGLSPAACKPRSDESALRWGFLADDSLLAGGPQFLINEPPGSAYRVCLAKYFAEALPGSEAEIQAAAGIWGEYIGRKIEVQLQVVDLPPAGPHDTVETLAATYAAQCAGYDTVIGLGPLDGSAVGLTGAAYKYFANADGTPHVVSFTRFLFLRDFHVAPAPALEIQGWLSLKQAFGQTPTPAALLTQLQARNRVEFADGQFLALPVLIHEFGHVWGLCDQYEGPTNCDAHHSTSHIALDSMMGASGARQRLYLTDDDVTGIRTLAARAEVAGAWHTDPAALKAPVAPIVLADLEVAKIRAAVAHGTHLVVSYAVKSNRPGRLIFAVRPPGGGAFQPLSAPTTDQPTIDAPRASLDIALGSPAAQFTVRMSVVLKGADGSDLAPIVTEAQAVPETPATSPAPGTVPSPS